TLVSMLPKELCRTSAWLYDLARRLPQSSLKQGHLDRLADLDPGSDFTGNPHEFFKFVFQDFWDSFRKEVDDGKLTPQRLLVYPRCLGGYRWLIEQHNGLQEGEAFWREEFARRLEENAEDFKRILVSVLRN